MADSTIGALSAASALDATEIYPASQGGNSRGVTGAQIQTMVRRAGSSTAGSWPVFGSSANLLSSEVAGAEEFDGNVEFFGLDNSSRAVGLAEYFACLSATYTLANNANTQKLFNVPANGALTLPTGLYFFDSFFSLSSMDAAAASNCQFDIKGGGGATLGDVLYMAIGVDGATATVANQSMSMSNASASATSALLGVANAAMQATVRGMFRVTGQGTIIPSVKLQTAAAAVVAVGSYFRCRCMGASGATTCGNWS